MVENLIQDLRLLSEANATRLINEVPRDLPVQADAALLTQVWQNLLSNAIRFTPGGTVRIGARQSQGHVECWVEDNGEGIPAERIDRVFEKLETDPDPEKSSTGLGLAIVKQAVEAHGGEVRVDSVPREGSKFTFTLPVRERAPVG